jgi:hypothetical protein
VPVETVERGVELAADKPFRFGHFPFEHFVPLAGPVELPSQFAPEPGRIVLRPLPHFEVLRFALDVRGGGEFRRRRKRPRFVQNTGDATLRTGTHERSLLNAMDEASDNCRPTNRGVSGPNSSGPFSAIRAVAVKSDNAFPPRRDPAKPGPERDPSLVGGEERS